MKTLTATLLIIPALLGSLASAQGAGTIAFSVNQTSAQTSLTPILTWSTSPAAASCTGSGGWTGTKAASGRETVIKITKSTAYTLTCRWNGGTATVEWAAPTTNTNGTPLMDLVSYKVLYGTSAANLAYNAQVNDPTASSLTVSSLSAGTWYFAARVINSSGVESANSNVAQKAVSSSASSAAKTLNVAITTAPPTNVRKTVETPVYDVVRTDRWVRGVQVGTIAIGKVCSTSYSVPGNYFGVTRSDVTITRTPRSTTVVAKCYIGT